MYFQKTFGMRTSTAAFALLTLVSEVMCELQVKGFVGGGLLIKCKFDSKFKDTTKYFCRSDNRMCPFEKPGQAVDSRYKEFNVRDEGFYAVFIKQLVDADVGDYKCAVANEEPTKVRITIKQDDCCTQPLVMASPVGRHIDIPCKYPQESSENKKVFCKQGNVFTCSNLIETKTMASNRRFSVTDDKERKTFTVRLTNVTSRDYGVYWCGVRTGGNSDSVALITEVQLQAPGAPAPPPPTASVDLPLLVGVCLSLTLLVLGGIAVLICLKNRHHKTKSTPSPANLALRTSRDQKQACADSEYCEIKDAGHPPCPAVVDNLAYPADPADPSDPTDESSYATVTFHKNPEDQGEACSNNALQEEDAGCEYAAVKHHS